MKSRYTIHTSPTLTADVQEFLVIEWGRTLNGRDDPSGKLMGVHRSLEAAMDSIHGYLLGQQGTVLHVGAH
jgi:hypothetical protein